MVVIQAKPYSLIYRKANPVTSSLITDNEGKVVQLTLPTTKSTSLEYRDEETNETLVILDLIMAQLQLEDLQEGQSQTSNWLQQFADWIKEEGGGREVNPTQAWFIARDVKVCYEELKKNYAQSRTSVFGTTSIPSEENSPPLN